MRKQCATYSCSGGPKPALAPGGLVVAIASLLSRRRLRAARAVARRSVARRGRKPPRFAGRRGPNGLQDDIVVERVNLLARHPPTIEMLLRDMPSHDRQISSTIPAFTAVMPLNLLQLRVDRRAVRSGRNGGRVAEQVRVIVLQVMGQSLSKGIRNPVFPSKVSGNLRAGDRKGKATLWPTADQQSLIRVGVQLTLGKNVNECH